MKESRRRQQQRSIAGGMSTIMGLAHPLRLGECRRCCRRDRLRIHPVRLLDLGRRQRGHTKVALDQTFPVGFAAALPHELAERHRILLRGGQVKPHCDILVWGLDNPTNTHCASAA